MGLLETGLGLVGGAIGGVISSNRQFRNEKELMELQNKYNVEMAEANHERNKEMWDYTNYENQVEHMKNAGLSVGLMYGQGGGMGASAAGGAGSGATGAGTNSGSVGAQTMGMILNAAQANANVEATKAQAEKTKAETKKIEGVDTDETKANIEKIIAETNNEKIKRGLILADGRLKDAQEELARATKDLTDIKGHEIETNIKSIEKGLLMLDENIKGTQLDNKLKEETMETAIEQAKATLQETWTRIALSSKGIEKTEAEIQNLFNELWARGELVQQGWQKNRLTANQQRIEAGKIAQELGIQTRALDIQQQKMIIDTVVGILNVAASAATMGKAAIK